jgi:amidophosphoribosyltransferase
MIEQLGHYCGIFGVMGEPDAAKMTYLGLYALQHRGQESSGIVTSDGRAMHERIGLGLVGEVFPDDKSLANLTGDAAIGHNRYSTTGTTLLANAQPFLVNFHSGQIAAAHNGNIVNAQILRSQMECDGSIFRTTTDTEIIVHLIARSKKKTVPDMIADALSQVRGAFSLLFLNETMLIGVKDPNSFRPLVLGKRNGAYFLASETCAFDLIDVEYIRSLDAGEMIVIERGREPVSVFPWGKLPLNDTSYCIFEFIYFSRPDSIVYGKSVNKLRRAMGAMLFVEQPADADIVISVPDSSNTAALGYSHGSGIPFELGLIRNHYIGRTFIQPSQKIRDFGVRLKYNPVRDVLDGKRVVLVDDSIVRGTTSKQLVKLIREAGATEVHMRIASPPITHSCFYGIDTPDRTKLIAANHSVGEIADFLGVDTLGYLSLQGMLSLRDLPECGSCTACFGSPYPVEVEDLGGKEKMRL